MASQVLSNKGLFDAMRLQVANLTTYLVLVGFSLATFMHRAHSRLYLELLRGEKS